MIPTDVIAVLLLAVGSALILLICALIAHDGGVQDAEWDEWEAVLAEQKQGLPAHWRVTR